MRTGKNAEHGPRRWKEVILAGVASVGLLSSGFVAVGAPVASATPQPEVEDVVLNESFEQQGPASPENSGSATGGDEAGLALVENSSGRQVAPASAPKYMRLQKVVNKKKLAELEPGQSFEYQIQVSASEEDVVGAKVVDTLPDLSGFTLQSVVINPSTVPGEIKWFAKDEEGVVTEIPQPSVLQTGMFFEVDYKQDLGSGAVGIEKGKTSTVHLTAKVPADFSPLDSRNGVQLPNTARGTSANAAPVEDSANIIVETERKLDVGISKSWTPATQAFSEGASSEIALRAWNESNVPVDTLIVEDTPGLTDGASLPSSSPFALVDFVGFAATSLPEGAETVQVDAYVVGVDGKGMWVAGAPAATFALPVQVDSYSSVAGLRFTFRSAEGASERDRIQVGSLYAAKIGMEVAQRATNRVDGSDLSKQTSKTTNIATAKTELVYQDEVLTSSVKEARAPFEITPPKLEAHITKSLSPAVVGKGVPTSGTLTATNRGSFVETMTVSDNNAFFDGLKSDWLIRFGGFTQEVTYPNAAVSGKVVYHLGEGNTQEVPFASGTVPGAPSTGNESVVGFDFVFASEAGKNQIVSGASTTIKFDVSTNQEADLGEGVAEAARLNESSVRVVAANGLEKSHGANATVKVVEPDIKLTLDKRVRPGNLDVLPGQNVLVELDSKASPTPNVGVQSVVVTDRMTEAQNDFWKAFDVTAIRPTQVLPGYAVQVEYTTGADTWTALTPLPSLDENQMLVVDEGAFAALVGTDLGKITGIRFTMTAEPTNNAGRGNEGTVPFQPNLGFTARQTLRGSDDAAPKGKFNNAAFADTAGKPSPGGEVGDDSSSDTNAGVGTPSAPEVGPGPGTSAWIGKAWNTNWVLSQTGDMRETRLSWNVSSGHEWVSIADPADSVPSVGQSVFNAFNLTAIDPIWTWDAPAYHNVWYLKWDKITKVELFNSTTSAWEEVTAPNGSWQYEDRSFKGYSLSPTQQATTTGVRIKVEEDAAARTGTTDPTAPSVGSGVTGGLGAAGKDNPSNRFFNLKWQVRDIARDKVDVTDGSQWVSGQRDFNVADDKGIVRNDVRLAWGDADGEKGFGEASDTITITDPKAAVTVKKTVSKSDLVVPEPGTIAAKNYPTSSYTIRANNAAGGTGEQGRASRAQWVRIIDPRGDLDTVENTAADMVSNPWAGANGNAAPAGFTLGDNDPFNWSNITKLTIGASKPAQVSQEKSLVHLLRFDESTKNYSAETVTVPQANAMTPAALNSVVGFAVVFTSNNGVGDNGADGGGQITVDNNLTIKVDTQLRTTLRNSGEDTRINHGEFVETDNEVFAQLGRPEGIGPGDDATATSNAEQKLHGEVIDIAPSKNISPQVLYEPTSAEDVTVSLGAKQGSAANASSPWKVVVEDYRGSESFWNVMNLKSLDAIVAPAGADLVQVDVHVYGEGDETWVTGSPVAVAQAELPGEVALDQIDGLRFTFTRSGTGPVDGKGPIFSDRNDPKWSTTINFTANLRATDRAAEGAITFPHAAVTNTVQAQSFGLNTDSSQKKAEDILRFEEGTRELQIGKLANEGVRMVSGGATIPWDIVAKNNGTGYLDLAQIVDTLPEKAVYTGQDDKSGPGITFPHLPAGVAEPEAALSADGRTVTFSWGDGEARLLPGENIQIRLWLELQPGVASNQKVTNSVDVTSAQALDAVSPYIFVNTDGGDDIANVDKEGFRPGDYSANSWDYVEIYAGSALQVYKGVHGPEDEVVSGAVSWNVGANQPDLDAQCATFQGNDGQTYYRSPCVANSQQGKTDTWNLRVANAGTTSQFNGVWVVDALPAPGDLMLVAGTDRGSMFRPVLTGAPKVHLVEQNPGQVDMDSVLLQVTTFTGAVCEGAWANMPPADLHGVDLSNVGPCTENGAVWENVDSDAGTFGAGGNVNWEDVTGIRIYYHNDAHDTVFHPGDIADVVYQTTNVIKTEEHKDGASNTIPVPRNELAWNQFGVAFLPGDDGGLDDVVAPNKVGTRLLNGSIQVEKNVEGAAAQYAPDTFTATVRCEIPGGQEGAATPLYFAGATTDAAATEDRVVELKKNPAGTYEPVRIHGIPVGAVCSVIEDGEVGDFGESLRSATAQTLTVSEPDTAFGDNGEPTNEVPTAQISTLTNTYNWGGLSVTKNVVTEADKGTFGPFDFELSCVTSDNQKVLFPVEGDEASETATFTLGRDETWDAPTGTIPVGSTCELVEVTNGGADKTVITGDNLEDHGNGRATIVVRGEGTDTAVVSTLVDNHFEAGVLIVRKLVEGTGADKYGTGQFGFKATCEYNNEEILAEDFTLGADETKTFGVFPAGTICSVEETDVVGAHETALDPEDGLVTIVGPAFEEGVEPALVGVTHVNATNVFHTGSLEVEKFVVGDGAALRGQGPFEVQVSCTYEQNGETVDVELPDSGKLVLSEQNGYRASIKGIYAGAQCTVIETEDGGADETEIGPDDGHIIVEADEVAYVSVVNTFYDVADPDPTPDPTPDPNGGGVGGGGLSKTGAQVTGVALAALALLGVGGFALASTRKRGRGRHAA